jgi:hypothetical protein
MASSQRSALEVKIRKMTNNRPATENEIAVFDAIKTVVERHAAETKRIIESEEPTKLLQLALEDASTAKALFALDPDGLSAALAMVEKNTDRNNLVDTLHSLCDIGEGDAVARALKNVTFGAIQKNAGLKTAEAVKTVQTHGSGSKITTGKYRSPVKFNGSNMKRGPTNSFNNVVDAPTKAFNRVVSDHLNVNAGAKSILKEAIARKAAEDTSSTEGRLANTTKAALTLKTPPTTQKGGKPVNKFDADETWTDFAKKEAEESTGQMKPDIVAGKTIDIPTMRVPSYENTRARLPFEFRGVNPSDAAERLSQGVVDVVNPNGSAHGPIDFNTGNTSPNTEYHGGPRSWQNSAAQLDVNLNKPKPSAQMVDPVNAGV